MVHMPVFWSAVVNVWLDLDTKTTLIMEKPLFTHPSVVHINTGCLGIWTIHQSSWISGEDSLDVSYCAGLISMKFSEQIHASNPKKFFWFYP